MIRKLKSGKYRLYSRKTDPKTGKRRNLGTFDDRGGRREARARGAILQAQGRLRQTSCGRAGRYRSQRSM